MLVPPRCLSKKGTYRVHAGHRLAGEFFSRVDVIGYWHLVDGVWHGRAKSDW